MNERRLGDHPIIVGSVPSPYDTFWRHIESQGYNIILFERNREKGVDTTIVSRIVQTVCEKSYPAIIALVTGDIDFCPPINIALDKERMDG